MNCNIKIKRFFKAAIICALFSPLLFLIWTNNKSAASEPEKTENVLPQPQKQSHEENSRQINWFDFGKKPPPLIANFINLAILLFIIWYFGRKPIEYYFAERRDKIKKQIEEAEKIINEASSRYEKIARKFEKMDEEIETLKKQMISEATIENERIISNAHKTAQMTRENAIKMIEQEKEMLIEKIKNETGLKILQEAEKILKSRVRKTMQRKMVDQTIQYIMKGNGK